MAVEVLAAPVVDRGRSGVGVASGDLHVAQGDAGVEGGHDERRSQHVRVHCPQAGALADRADPAVGGTPIEPLSIAAAQDWSLATFADCQVDRASRTGDQRDRGRLVALAENAERPVAPFEAGSSMLVAHASLTRSPFSPSSTASAACSRSYCSAVNRNTASSERSSPRALDGCTCGRRTYCAGFEAIRPSM